jgi:hypothetical protein
MAGLVKIAVVIMAAFLVSCQLFFQTQVSFQNGTSSYTFLEIKLGSVDYATTLPPGQQTSFFPIGPGLYTLYTTGVDGVVYSWPVKQPIAGGYSYTIIFGVNSTTNALSYSTYIALQE